MNRLNGAWNDATDLIRKVPGVEWTLDNVFSGLLELVNEMTQDSVMTSAILKSYRDAGHAAVLTPADIHHLDLATPDALQSGLRAKYNTLAAAEGAATGMAGAAGILPDIIALVALNLRAAGEYATYYGFPIREVDERLFALRILDMVSSSSDSTKDLALAPVVRVSKSVAKQQSLEALQQTAIMRTIRSIGQRLTRVKLAQLVPLTSAVIGGSFNAYYTNKVSETAYHIYRERFLIAKYGRDVWKG